MTTIDLLAGSLRLRLAPSAGGSITRFDVMHGGIEQPLLRGAEGLPDHALESACFPLVPFSNRIRGGSFTFRDRRISLRPNMTGDPSPLHGQGWLVPWQVEEASSTDRSEEHTSEIQSLMRISYAVFRLKKKKNN